MIVTGKNMGRKADMDKKGDRLTFNSQQWVAIEDYLTLKAALKEALDGWDDWSDGSMSDRIEVLRKLTEE